MVCLVRNLQIDIARILCVSSRTLSCRHQELGMSVGHASNFGQISDASALDDLVRNILTSAPQSGIGLSTGNLIKVSTVLIKVHMTRNFFISLFERAFKMMKNGVYFIVIALLVAELFKTKIWFHQTS